MISRSDVPVAYATSVLRLRGSQFCRKGFAFTLNLAFENKGAELTLADDSHLCKLSSRVTRGEYGD